MKKLLLIIFLLGGLITGYFTVPQVIKSAEEPEEVTPVTTFPDNQSVGIPVSFTIPSLGVQTVVESVGMDTEGKMDVPKNEDNVAWYNLGFKPGDAGSAVIAGHFDKKSGAPAVFYKLNELQTGDEIFITDENDKNFTFVVDKIVTYEHDELPLQEIFNTPGTPTLNLITCEGSFDKSAQNYSHRTVVYTTLKQSVEN